MQKLSWPTGVSPVAASERVPIERFGPSNRRWVIWLLEDVRTRYTHWPQHLRGSGSLPCLKPLACPMCSDVQWHKRIEGYAPALSMNAKARRWENIVAVFTEGSLRLLPPAPQTGLQIQVWREKQGRSPVGKLKIAPFGKDWESSRFQLLTPAFDVEPWLMRMWFPHESHPPVDPPQDLPFDAKKAYEAPEPEPTKLDPEMLAKLHEQLKSNGMLNHAAKVHAELVEVLGAGAPPAAEPEPEPEKVPNRKPTETERVNDHFAKAALGGRVVAGPADPAGLDTALDAAIFERTGQTVSRETRDRLPNGHPAKPANGKGGGK